MNDESLAAQQVPAPVQLLEWMTGCFSCLVVAYDTGSDAFHFSPSQLEQELGYPVPVQDSGNLNFLSLVHAGDQERFRILIDRVRERQAVADEEIRLLHWNGTVVAYLLTGHRGDGDWGERAMLVLTRRRAAEEKPRPAETVAQQNSLPEELLHFGSFEYDDERGSAYWSEGLYLLLGYGPERPAAGRELFLSHLVADTDGDGPVDQGSDAAEYVQEYNVLTLQGLMKRVQVTGRRLYDAQGRLSKEVGLVRDMTRQRLKEQMTRRYVDELQRSNRELEEFAYIASHDLQEPLRKISTFSSRLQARLRQGMDPEGHEYLNRIITSVENMRLLIDNLLEFSLITRTHERFVPVDLNMVLSQVWQDLELKVEETGAKMMVPPLPVVMAAQSQMKQLFFNLLGNAIKFRKPGVIPHINIEYGFLDAEEKAGRQLTPDRNYYRIAITDNGIGFEPEYAARIFQVFQRLHGKSEYPGSGIGLAICKKIVDHHGGAIDAVNIPGQGARFVVVLPVHAEETLPRSYDLVARS